MAQLDPNIILSGQDPAVQQQNALRLNQLQMQAQQQAQEQRDALQLRNIFQQPGSLDEKTGEPTGQALNQIMKISPKMGMDIQKSVLAAQKAKVDLSAAQLQAFIDKGDLVDRVVRTPALAAYDDAKEKRLPEQAARDAAQSVMSEGLGTLEKEGNFSDEEKAKFPRKFDPDQMRDIDQQYALKRAELLDKKKARELQERGVRVSERSEGRQEQEFSLKKAGVPLDDDSLDEAAHDYRKTGKLPPGVNPTQVSQIIGRAGKLRKSGDTSDMNLDKPVEVETVGADGKHKTILAQQDKDSSQWVTADKERKPVEVTGLSGKTKGEFTPEMGALMGSLAEKGVSLPTGFRSKEQQIQLYQGLLDRNPGKSADQIADMVKSGQIEFGAQKKETQTAAAVAGKVEVAQNEINEFIPLVREASAKVPRSRFVPLNKLVQMGESSISDPNLKALRIRINSLLNAYDMLAARGGTDKDKRAEVRNLLLAADGPDALDAALKSFELEAEAAHRAAVKATKVPELPDTSAPSAPRKAGSAPAPIAPAGQFEEGKVYRDAKGNKARYQGGKFVPVE